MSLLPHKRRAVTLGVLASAASLVVAACGDQMGPNDQLPDCSQYTACGTCTPIVGCGWCFDGKGGGTCHSGPAACTAAGSKWNWDPAGCHVPFDGSVPGDAAAD